MNDAGEIQSHGLGRTVLGAVLVVAATGAAQAGAATLVDRSATAMTGLQYAVGMLAGTAAGGALLALWLRGVPARGYLALRPAPARAWLLWLGLTLAVDLAIDAATRAAGRPAVPPEWRELWRTAGSPALLAVAVAVAAPVFEELFFRGYLHRGIEATRLGARGAVAITAVLFTLAHGPTDAFTLAAALSAAILFGLARAATGSVPLTIAMHALGNAKIIAMVALS